MFRKNLQLKLRTQLTLVILLVSTLTITLISFFLVYWEMDKSQNTIIQTSNTVTKILSQDAVQVLLLNSSDAASDMILKIKSFTAISNATFFDKNNDPLLNYNRDNTQLLELKYQKAGTIITDDNFITSYVLLEYQNNKYGTAAFRITREAFSTNLYELLKKEIYLLPFLVIFSYLFAVLFHRLFTKPLEKMAMLLQKQGDPNKVNLIEEIFSVTEMNDLTAGYNNMARRINTTQDELVEQKQRLHVTLDAIADGVIATDTNSNITFMNPSAEYICGWNEEEARGQSLDTIYRLINQETSEPIINHIEATLINGTVQHDFDNMILQVKQGDAIDIKSSVSPIRNSNKEITGAVVIFQNVTEMRQLNQKLQHQAVHDPLTNLINRGEFERLLDEHLENMDGKINHALMYLDLDQFKVVNDTSGHIAGDSLLKQISALLQDQVRESDIVARLGGDEFAVLLPHCSIESAKIVAENIRKQISSFTFAWEEEHFRVGVSIGLVPINNRSMTKVEILTEADVACYAAKDMGRNRVHLYSPDDIDLIHRRNEMQWITQITNALEENRLFLFAQKVIPINEYSKTEHLELLVRHIDKDGMLRTPGAFIPAIERYGLAPTFDRWIIKKALEDPSLVNYLKGSSNRCVNINLSGLTLGDENLTTYISDLLKKADLPPRAICFEITETAAIANFNTTTRFIKSMKLLGCDFALDDFGSGLSSFAYLKNLPVEYLKIDGSLIRDIDQNPVNEAMVNAINQIAHVMKMKTVAEFVENGNIQDKLVTMGVDYAQGYHIHIPAPLQDVIDEELKIKLDEFSFH